MTELRKERSRSGVLELDPRLVRHGLNLLGVAQPLRFGAKREGRATPNLNLQKLTFVAERDN